MQKNIAAGAQEEFFAKINYQLLVPLLHVIEKPREDYLRAQSK